MPPDPEFTCTCSKCEVFLFPTASRLVLENGQCANSYAPIAQHRSFELQQDVPKLRCSCGSIEFRDPLEKLPAFLVSDRIGVVFIGATTPGRDARKLFAAVGEGFGGSHDQIGFPRTFPMHGRVDRQLRWRYRGKSDRRGPSRDQSRSRPAARLHLLPCTTMSHRPRRSIRPAAMRSHREPTTRCRHSRNSLRWATTGECPDAAWQDS